MHRYRGLVVLLALAAASCGGTANPTAPRRDPMVVCQQAMAKVSGATAVGVAADLPGAQVECDFRVGADGHLVTYRVGADGVPQPVTSTT